MPGSDLGFSLLFTMRATPPAPCTCHERTFPRWQTPYPSAIERRARGTGGVRARQGDRQGAGKKSFCSSSESCWALSDPALQPNRVKLSSRWLLRRKAMHLKDEKCSFLLLAPPFPAPRSCGAGAWCQFIAKSQKLPTFHPLSTYSVVSSDLLCLARPAGLSAETLGGSRAPAPEGISRSQLSSLPRRCSTGTTTANHPQLLLLRGFAPLGAPHRGEPPPLPQTLQSPSSWVCETPNRNVLMPESKAW